MKRILITLLVALFVSTSATAAIKINASQAKSMDDVMSLGVIYINHNIATEQEALQALSAESDAHNARLYYPLLMHEPGSNGAIHASAEIYR